MFCHILERGLNRTHFKIICINNSLNIRNIKYNMSWETKNMILSVSKFQIMHSFSILKKTAFVTEIIFIYLLLSELRKDINWTALVWLSDLDCFLIYGSGVCHSIYFSCSLDVDVEHMMSLLGFHCLCCSFIDSHGVTSQSILLLQFSIQQIDGYKWGKSKKRSEHNT